MTKTHILQEIARTAEANGGRPLGWRRFAKETGIMEGDWLGRHWARWSDAAREAGYAPNSLNAAYPEGLLLEKFLQLTRDLGKIPNRGDLLFKASRDKGFPNPKTFSRLGPKSSLIKRACEYCQTHAGYEDVLPLYLRYGHASQESEGGERGHQFEETFGFVYLLKSGRYYKIGKTNAAGRREREIAIQLPEKLRSVHVIRTDDPTGIEAYWHERFKEKRKNGEWFDLDARDVVAFKRRKFM